MVSVTIIVPCFNEQSTIGLLLDAISKQDYPQSAIEVIIADGLSTDDTRAEISKFLRIHPDISIQVIDNERRIIPAGLNKAILAAQGEVIIRLDAHCVPYKDYVGRCVQALEEYRGDNVGGVWEILPGSGTWQANAISKAAAHFLGVGDAHYRYTDHAQEVDTVPFGAYFKSLIDTIGFYDEGLLTNEDYEFNVRLRESGGKVWLDPAIRSIYFARPSYQALADQYWRYGYWKAQMLRRYPGSIRWRQALPPLFILSVVSLMVLSIWLPIALWIVLLEIIAYGFVLSYAGIEMSLKERKLSNLFGVPAAIAVMHLSWGCAFIWGLISPHRH